MESDLVTCTVNDDEEGTVRLKLVKPKTDKGVRWEKGTVDNEHSNKKKSKCCCIYKKPKKFGDSSSSSDEDECASCPGHKKAYSDHVHSDGGSCPVPAAKS